MQCRLHSAPLAASRLLLLLLSVFAFLNGLATGVGGHHDSKYVYAVYQQLPPTWTFRANWTFEHEDVESIRVSPSIRCPFDGLSVVNVSGTFEQSLVPHDYVQQARVFPCVLISDHDNGNKGGEKGCRVLVYWEIRCALSCDMFCAKPVYMNTSHEFVCQADGTCMPQWTRTGVFATLMYGESSVSVVAGLLRENSLQNYVVVGIGVLLGVLMFVVSLPILDACGKWLTSLPLEKSPRRLRYRLLD